MARDAKPSEIELKRDDFSTPKQEIAAERLQKHWDSNCEFKKLAEEIYPEESEDDDEPSDSLYQNVYNEYFGPVGDRRTFEEVRAEFGTVANYLEERKKGNVQLQFNEDDKRELTKRELSLISEGYELAEEKLEEQADKQFDKGYERGFKNALDMVDKLGIEAAREMLNDEDEDEESEEISLPFQRE